MFKYKSPIYVLILALFALFWAVLFEIGGAAYFPAKYCLIYGAFWSALMLPLVISCFSRSKLAVYLTFICCLVILHQVPWSSRKPFLRDLRRIKPGMTVAEVEAIMAKYVGQPGLSPWPTQTHGPRREYPVYSSAVEQGPAPDENDDTLYYLEYRHTEHGDFYGDEGIVHFEKGKVSRVRFLPD